MDDANILLMYIIYKRFLWSFHHST